MIMPDNLSTTKYFVMTIPCTSLHCKVVTVQYGEYEYGALGVYYFVVFSLCFGSWLR